MLPLHVLIREESEKDINAISEVTAAAFKCLEVSRHTEQFIIEALRASGALTLSLVAELDGQVVGHVAFSPVTISDGTSGWFALGPISVLPNYQRKGIGKAIIWEGLARLKSLGAKGCCLVGHPEYYRKFGFINPPSLICEGVRPEVFFVLAFEGNYPHGEVSFHPAFVTAGPAPPEEEEPSPSL